MNLDLAVSYASVPGFPAGTSVASIQAIVTGTAPGNTNPQTQTQPPSTGQFIFPLTLADTYNYTVQGVDSGGNILGTPVTGSFAIAGATTVALMLPSAVLAGQS